MTGLGAQDDGGRSHRMTGLEAQDDGGRSARDDGAKSAQDDGNIYATTPDKPQGESRRMSILL